MKAIWGKEHRNFSSSIIIASSFKLRNAHLMGTNDSKTSQAVWVGRKTAENPQSG